VGRPEGLAGRIGRLFDVINDPKTGEPYTNSRIARMSLGDLTEEEVEGLRSGSVSDEFIDDKGDDVIYGGDGDDFFYPTSGKDVIYGGMAMISSTFPKTASQTSSIVAKARTNMAQPNIPKWIRTTT